MLKMNRSKVLVKKSVDLGRVVAAHKKVEGEGEKVSDEVKAETSNMINKPILF